MTDATQSRALARKRPSSDWRDYSDPVVDAWVADMQRRNLAARSIDKRRHNIARLCVDVGKSPGEVESADIVAFLDARPIKPQSRAHWISNIQVFYAFAVANEHYDHSPAARLSRPKLGRYLPNPTPEHELDKALAAATPLMRQWVTLMAFAGLRCAEVADLRGENVDVGAREIRVLGKGRKERTIPMHPAIADLLCDVSPRGHVFMRAEDGQPYTPDQISWWIGRHLRACGLTRKTAHKLRHRFASQLLEEGADISVVGDLLGHESLETTRGYAAVTMRRKRSAVDLLAVK